MIAWAIRNKSQRMMRDAGGQVRVAAFSEKLGVDRSKRAPLYSS
jgi:hypothetical protein